MAEEEYTKYLAQGKRPIAGQSLASDPENPAPYEKATEFSDVHEAIEYMFLSMIDEKSYMPIMQAVSSGTPVMELVQIILFDGFQKGKWNPDLMMMLAEPLAYIIIALAERADIEVSIYSGEKEDEDEEEVAEERELKFDRNRSTSHVSSNAIAKFNVTLSNFAKLGKAAERKAMVGRCI